MSRGLSRCRSRSRSRAVSSAFRLPSSIDSASGFGAAVRACGLGADAGDRHLVDAFRRHARREFSQRGRLSRAADAGLLPDLRARGRRRRLCGAERAACRRLRIGARRARDGARHLDDALCRHVGGAPRRADLSGAALRRRLVRRCRSPRARSLCWRSAAGRTGCACSSARSCSAWRSPACTIRRWRACGSTRCASTRAASSAPNRRFRATRWRCSRR